MARQASSTLIVSLADSEGDIYEYLLEAQAVEGVRKASFIIRACQNRALALTDDAGSPQSPHHLRERVASTPVQAQRTLEVRGASPRRTMIESESNRASPARPRWSFERRG